MPVQSQSRHFSPLLVSSPQIQSSIRSQQQLFHNFRSFSKLHLRQVSEEREDAHMSSLNRSLNNLKTVESEWKEFKLKDKEAKGNMKEYSSTEKILAKIVRNLKMNRSLEGRHMGGAGNNNRYKGKKKVRESLGSSLASTFDERYVKRMPPVTSLVSTPNYSHLKLSHINNLHNQSGIYNETNIEYYIGNTLKHSFESKTLDETNRIVATRIVV